MKRNRCNSVVDSTVYTPPVQLERFGFTLSPDRRDGRVDTENILGPPYDLTEATSEKQTKIVN